MTQNINPEDERGTRGGEGPSNPSKDGSLRVLVVDDDDGFRRSMCVMLRSAFDAEAVEADSGLTALDEVRRGADYDFIFLDVMMPGMSGLETYVELNRLGVRGRIFLMTAYPAAREWAAAKSMGLDLLDKPIAWEKWVELLGPPSTE